LRLDPRVEAQIKAARLVGLEFDFIKRDRRALTVYNRRDDRLVANNNGTWSTTPIKDVLGAEKYAWVDARLMAVGWQEGSAPFLRIDALAEMLLGDPCNDFAYGIYPTQDSYIQTLGAIHGVPAMGFEDEKDFRAKLSNPKNRALAFDVIRLFTASLDPAWTRAQGRSWAALWLSGQTGLAAALEREALRRQFGDNRGPDIQAHVDGYLLDERNVIFVDAAEPELQTGGVFIAVGASHIAGEAGMVSLLRDRGYDVTRIPLPREVQP